MENTQYIKNLTPPNKKIDLILDTDAYNEIDDQFAIAYLLRSERQLNIKGFVAAPFFYDTAPFFNKKATSPEDGMLKSYNEILKIIDLAKAPEHKANTYKGSNMFLKDEITPVVSEGVNFIIDTAMNYSPENPLYIVAIGAITNIASALLLAPQIKEKIVVVWLGGHAHHLINTKEFNMCQDKAAARVVMNSGVPFVQLPCAGVVDRFATSRYELEHWLKGVNPLCDYLLENTINEAESYASGKPWTRIIWDVTAISWLLNKDNKFMYDEFRPYAIPDDNDVYSFNPDHHKIKYVTAIRRDALFEDLFLKLRGDN